MKLFSLLILFLTINNSQASLDSIRGKGFLNCGVSNGVLGFSMPNEKGEWSGFDVDFCRSIGLAIFGVSGKVKFIPLNAKERFSNLENGTVDVLARNTSMTLVRSTLMNLHFSPTIFHDGQSFMSHKRENLNKLLSKKVCLVEGASSKRNLEDFYKEKKVMLRSLVFPTHDEAALAFDKNRCHLLSMDSSALASIRFKMKKQKSWWIHKEVISHEPLALVVKSENKKLANLVDWLVYGLIAAEELNLNSTNIMNTKKKTKSSKVRRLLGNIAGIGESLEVKKEWLYNVIKEFGHYGEIYKRNLNSLKLKRVKNNLWKKGGLLHSMPLR